MELALQIVRQPRGSNSQDQGVQLLLYMPVLSKNKTTVTTYQKQNVVAKDRIAAYNWGFLLVLLSSHIPTPQKRYQMSGVSMAKTTISYFRQTQHSMQMEVISAIQKVLSENAGLISIMEKWK